MAEEERILEVTPDFDGKRIDQCLAASFSDCSRSFLQKLLKDGKVSINGKTQKASSKVAAGDAVLVLLPEPEELNVEPENIPLDILYEDDDLLVVNKPKGMVVHPAAGHSSGTLVNAVLYHCRGNLSGINGVLRPGIVHRIDKDTTGALLICKNDNAHRNLAEQLKDAVQHIQGTITEQEISDTELEEQVVSIPADPDIKNFSFALVGEDIYYRENSVMNKMELPVSNAQVTDNFPGYVTQDTRVGLEWSRHHAGVLFNYMNTAGKKGITDYSGSCNFELRNKGYKFGAFYRFRLVKEEISIFTFEPYIQFSAGVVLNKVHEANRLFIESVPTAGYLQEGHFSSKNFFVEPAFGIKFGLCRHVALNVNIAYEWDAVKQNLKSRYSDFKVDWSGYKAQAGLIFYLNLKK